MKIKLKDFNFFFLLMVYLLSAPAPKTVAKNDLTTISVRLKGEIDEYGSSDKKARFKTYQYACRFQIPRSAKSTVRNIKWKR